MHRFAVALGVLGAIALSFGTAHAVSMRKPYVVSISTMVVAAIELTPEANALPIETADANGTRAADYYSWRHWPSVTDF